MTRALSIAICILLGCQLAAGAVAPQVRLRAAARAPGLQIRLCDVADVGGLDQAVGQVVVLTMSRQRPARRLTLSQVQDALRQAGVNPVPIRFCGSAWCDVAVPAEATPVAKADDAPGDVTVGSPPPQQPGPAHAAPGTSTQPAAGRTIADRIVDQLAEQLGTDRGNIVLTFKSAHAAVAGSSQRDIVGVTSTDRRCVGRRRWRVVYASQTRKPARYLIGEVLVRRKVVVASRQLRAGETIGPGDVEAVVRPDSGDAGPMTDLAAVVGQKTRRRIRASRVIKASDLTKPQLVRRGHTAWVRCGPVKVSAKALSGGREGEQVQFENLRSRRRFWAVVTGPGTAEVAPVAAQAR